MQTFDCQVCFDSFNNETQQPLIFKNCGHSACRLCIQSLVENAIRKKENFVECVSCRKKQPFSGDFNQIFNFFPKNYLFIEYLSSQNNFVECVHDEKKYFCLNIDCHKNGESCLKCLGKIHSECPENQILKSKTIKSKIDLLTMNAREQFPIQDIKKSIKTNIEWLEKTLFSIADSFEKILENELIQFDEMSHNLDVFKRKFDEFDFKIDSESETFELNWPRLKDLNSTSNEISNFLSKQFFELATKNLNYLLLRKAPFLKVFDCKNSPINPFPDEEKEFINCFFYSDFHLSDYKSKVPFSFSEFYSDIRNHKQSNVEKLSFFEQNGLNADQIEEIKKILEFELAKKDPFIGSTEENIRSQLSELFKKEFLVRFEIGEYDLGIVDEKIYFKTEFENSELILIIQEV